jgi:lysine-specific demethylase/histidyl-hydroxylase NO66
VKQLVAGKLKYNHDLDVTKYEDGARETLNAEGNVEATEEELRSHFKDGCSVRLLRPQEHFDVIWRTVACLESFWKCGGGANSYLTPAGTQGFAPHFDDIEAFVLQLEGEKKWKVYSPYDGDDLELRKRFPLLPNVSSRDFAQEELSALELAHDVTLCPGDLLYLPRGVVHQARSVDDKHSLHLTLSSGQRNTVGDFLKRALPAALEEACHDANTDESATLLRAALPLDYTDYMGVMHSDLDEQAESAGATKRRTFVEQMVRVVTEAVLEHMPFDITADEMASAFQHDRHLPDVVRRAGESDSESDDDDDDDDDDDEEVSVCVCLCWLWGSRLFVLVVLGSTTASLGD